MSRSAYERVRKALEGTGLAGQIEKLCAELHLTPESPEWTIAALAIIATEPLTERLSNAERCIAESADILPDNLRATGIHIAREVVRIVSGSAVKVFNEEAIAELKGVTDGAASRLDDVIAKHESKISDCLSPLISNAHDLKLQHDLLARFFQRNIVAHWLTYALVAAIAASGTFFATFDYDHAHLYRAGWNDGAAAVRASLHNPHR